MVANKNPAVFLHLDLALRPILPGNAKLIDRRVGAFKGARLLAMKRRMPGLLKKLPIGYLSWPSDRFWQRLILPPGRGRPHRAERRLQLLRGHLDHMTCFDVIERLLQDCLERF
jgi:hypothetical protein